ncbi:SprT-like domain-containing protein [Erwinia pyrifoliae]|uniref:SprT-like domain-containing protein n=1 Tax=Erwinia pyrifoliae TaxID=79967 RepID=UPI00223C1FC8|nr:SprT-like domain-containing protein [Erwinia pyrifoliae]MCT2388852.1 SprT-like domain-containing protein [Erwinia pyrifoliae]
MRHLNRESWLNDVAQRLAPLFQEAGAPLPDNVRLSIGFTSTGKRSKRIGECWDNRCSADGYFEIFIRPDLAEAEDTMPVQVAAILAHELIHAAVGIEAGHGKDFGRVARAIGLNGPMRSTTPGVKFIKAFEEIQPAIGPLPHGRLNTDGESTKPKQQKNRHVKCACEECGYAIRTARKWLAIMGPPHCPKHGVMKPEEAEAEAEAEKPNNEDPKITPQYVPPAHSPTEQDFPEYGPEYFIEEDSDHQ